ncbi:MAG TPA: hypothetical protein VLX56_03190 [Nitrososphaerales archaeon]|nr:hypothetical protein [Nitrososphaerales archaeon]
MEASEVVQTTNAGLTLTEQELGVAKANLRFALENCPVDGGILVEDGCSFTRETVESLLSRLESWSPGAAAGTAPSDDDLKVMRALADYALEDCPIEGGLFLDDGSLVSRSDLRAYREKIGDAPSVGVG